MTEMIQRIARLDLGDTSGIIISNIDTFKIDRLLHMFAGVDIDIFRQGEILIFPTQNKEAARKITQAIPSDIADVHGFADGYLFCLNDYDTE
jgi:hypothetical protein